MENETESGVWNIENSILISNRCKTNVWWLGEGSHYNNLIETKCCERQSLVSNKIKLQHYLGKLPSLLPGWASKTVHYAHIFLNRLSYQGPDKCSVTTGSTITITSLWLKDEGHNLWLIQQNKYILYHPTHSVRWKKENKELF
jgi:hypothetical protein